MKLTDARQLLKKCQERGPEGFIIKRHCWVDQLERKFTKLEVLNLLRGKGILKVNRYPSAKSESFLWCCKDKDDRDVEIAVLFDSGQIIAIAISAYRRITK